MTSIEQLIAQPEGKTLEFKRDLSSPKPLLKTLVAFANTAGGRLFVGVDDQRKVVGVVHPLDDEERLSMNSNVFVRHTMLKFYSLPLSIVIS